MVKMLFWKQIFLQWKLLQLPWRREVKQIAPEVTVRVDALDCATDVLAPALGHAPDALGLVRDRVPDAPGRVLVHVPDVPVVLGHVLDAPDAGLDVRLLVLVVALAVLVADLDVLVVVLVVVGNVQIPARVVLERVPVVALETVRGVLDVMQLAPQGTVYLHNIGVHKK